MKDRIPLLIDVFKYPNQKAEALADLSVYELIQEILQEFASDRGMEFLRPDKPDEYELVQVTGDTLKPNQYLSQLELSGQTHLVLREKRCALPNGAKELPGRAYLIYSPDPAEASKAFRLCWQPAIIGRSTNRPDNHLLVLDAAAEKFPNSSYVSRRHAQIIYDEDHYKLVPLTKNNPTFLNGEELASDEGAILKSGSLVGLPGENETIIRLRFFLPDEEGQL